ncbi:Crp/Fnr family transcriptional regulator [Belliella pelovolcani]|uniref:cAMP-binding domain of CRP or a regulatory subunit of cAMP-dependent protein kinases n=1 Tax=Belliella pelovolcani TaxID=529505 RepID=A0A1N7MK57_9BACT|nr:Crp/Fnr family transcriptional regulator [Belliella pelovolcani]SIS86493.1 cAMP-binding domain of CRP or a regulatory subunit of cAMP-dependent protein kinases [Belliella pelovolcani]
MNRYKRILQVKKYAMENNLFFEELYHDMLKNAHHLSFRKNSLIKLHQGKESLYFLNQGIVVGSKHHNLKGDWIYCLYPQQIFGDYQDIVGAMMPKLNWFALYDVELIAISCQIFKNALVTFPEYFNRISAHLFQLEFDRLETIAEINRRNLPEKLKFLEHHNPDLIINAKFKDLAKYMGVSRQHLYRELLNKNYIPSM